MTPGVLGIVGSGQLGLYLAQAAKKMNYQLWILADSVDDPATRFADRVFLNQEKELEAFFSGLDLLTFENEFFPQAQLKYLKGNTQVFPSLECIQLLKNKFEQKKLLDRLHIQTSSYYEITSVEDLATRKDRGVIKASSGAYDGKGLFFRNEANLQEAKSFIQGALAKGISLYEEDPIDFEVELAIQASFHRGQAQNIYPLVHTVQPHGYCKWVIPFSSENFENWNTRAQEIIKKIASELSYTGILAVEFFAKESTGDLWVNELAPRVHNSGHYTMNAFEPSQFTAHLQSVRPTETHLHSQAPWLMYNLIAPQSGTVKKADKIDVELSRVFPEAFAYWYGKKEARPHRKMGHLNFPVTGKITKEFMEKVSTWEKELWEKIL